MKPQTERIYGPEISHLPHVSIIYVLATAVNAIIEMFGIF